jgi:hypothetical protein
MRRGPKNLIELFKDMFVCCLLGCVSGVGVGFFVFLRLGFPHKSEYLVGYICGLFVVSGMKFGITVWLTRIIGFSMLDLWSCAGSFASSYAFKDMDLNPGSQGLIEPTQVTRDVDVPNISFEG